MNYSNKIRKLKKEILYLTKLNHNYEKDNYHIIRKNNRYRKKIDHLTHKNNFFYDLIQTLIIKEKKYYKLQKRYKNLLDDFDNLNNYISNNKKNFKDLKECQICCNFIVSDDYSLCKNPNCNIYMHNKCLLKTKYKGKKCIYCFNDL